MVIVKPLLDRAGSVSGFLDMTPDAEREAALEKGLTIGRPLMEEQALGKLEKTIGRSLRPGKRGRPAMNREELRQEFGVNGKVSP